MKLILYQYDESIHIIEDIEHIEVDAGDVTVYSPSGRLHFQEDDVVKGELVP